MISTRRWTVDLVTTWRLVTAIAFPVPVTLLTKKKTQQRRRPNQTNEHRRRRKRLLWKSKQDQKVKVSVSRLASKTTTSKKKENDDGWTSSKTPVIKESKDDEEEEEESSKAGKERRKLIHSDIPMTYYWIARPEDYNLGGKQVTIKTCDGKTLGKTSIEYADALVMEGTGILGNEVVNLGACPCTNYNCFMEINGQDHPYGLTCKSPWSLRPKIADGLYPT